MYSFHPLPDYSDVHWGFYVLGIIIFAVWVCILLMWKEREIYTPVFIGWTVLLWSLIFFAHLDSYTPNHPINEKHIGEFVGFESEGYSERSGKSKADHHYTYVVYKIDGAPVMFQAELGQAYPPRVVVYKNNK